MRTREITTSQGPIYAIELASTRSDRIVAIVKVRQEFTREVLDGHDKYIYTITATVTALELEARGTDSLGDDRWASEGTIRPSDHDTLGTLTGQAVIDLFCDARGYSLQAATDELVSDHCRKSPRLAAAYLEQSREDGTHITNPSPSSSQVRVVVIEP